MAAKNPWNGELLPDSTPGSAPKESKASKPFNRERIKSILSIGGGAAGLALVAALAYNNRDEIGPHARSAFHTLGAFGVNVADGLSSPNVLPDSPADRVSQARALVNEDMAGANNFEVQLQIYRLAHPNYRNEPAYNALKAERRMRADHILTAATRILGKEDSRQSWGTFLEGAWDRPEIAPLLSTGLIYGIAIALHRASNDIGDTYDQDAARTAFQLFSRSGWQSERNLANVTDAAGLHYGVVTNLERENIMSFHVARRQLRNGAYELVADREFVTAMNARLSNIHRVIEEKRTAGQLNLHNVLATLEAQPDTTGALANVPVEVTLAAVWTRLNLSGATIDEETRRLAVLGTRPITTVLPLRDPVGGGIVKAHELVPAEVPDPTRFVVVR